LTFLRGEGFRIDGEEEIRVGAHLKIGEAARAAGVTPKAIRFYESTGLLPAPVRGPNRYRLYTPDALDTLRFIKQASGLGLTLTEIREVLTIRWGGRPPCAHVHRLLSEKARELDQKLADLLALRRQLRQSLRAWRRGGRGPGKICPHLESGVPRRTTPGKAR
jgi:MerR family transcriptional regulator, copper efflux regulator